MAVDLHLLQQFRPGDSPIFRLYSWERPTLSLGRNEKIDQGINLDFCREEQIPLIRRMTGGKAVLHQSDLTYSIIGELGDPQFGEGVHETYRSLAEGFLLFFEKLGLKPQLVDASSSRDLEPHLCFTVPSLAEILVEGRKLIGSAQRIRGSASQGRFFLQHGSIPPGRSGSQDAFHFPQCRRTRPPLQNALIGNPQHLPNENQEATSIPSERLFC